MKVLDPELRPLRYALRQLYRSVRAGRPMSWPNFRRLAMRSGAATTGAAHATWDRVVGRGQIRMAGSKE